MARVRIRGVTAAAIIIATVTNCKDDDGGRLTGLKADPGIHFRAGATTTDTVDASPLQALVVEVRDEDGRPAVGHTVRFTSVPNPGASPFAPYRVYVSPVELNSFSNLAADVTNERGQASVILRFGTSAGPGRIAVSVPDLGMTDTTTFTVSAGAASRVVAAPKDTALFAGGMVTMRSAVTDRYGNPRNDPVTITRASGGVTVAGKVVSAQTTGIAKVVTAALGITDTTTIAVVPSGIVLAASAPGVGVVTLNLDGSGYRVVTSTPSTWVRWAPDATELTFDNEYAVPARIVTMAGVVRPVRQSSTGTQAEMYPVFSPDKKWVYVSVIESSTFRLWRAKPDGSEAAPLVMNIVEDEFYPSPSPDGTRLAYVRRTGFGEDYMRILDLATGTVSKIDVPGHAPAWSPLGDLIAYVDLRAGAVIKVMRPDGTGIRQVSPTGNYEKSVQWSPDGKWLIAYGGQPARIQLIDVAAGAATPIGYAMTLRSPSWKP